jgi:hypothetical protein
LSFSRHVTQKTLERQQALLRFFHATWQQKSGGNFAQLIFGQLLSTQSLLLSQSLHNAFRLFESSKSTAPQTDSRKILF